MTELNAALARRIVGLLDLTSLNDDDSDERIVALCERALTPVGPTAAVCVHVPFVALARRTLDKLGGAQVKVATVVNFPSGANEPSAVLAEVRAALAAGADEIDLVFPQRALRDGDTVTGPALVRAVKELCAKKALLKVILETGELKDGGLIRRASELAIGAGADFIKTSTGKVPVNATPEAAQIMLEVIAEAGGRVGFKPAGGMKTLAEAAVYLQLAEHILGADWVSPAHLRFGASSLLSDLLAHSGHGDGQTAEGGY